MPQASILELETPPLDQGEKRRSTNTTSTSVGSGRLCLIELCGGGLDLNSTERQALGSADIIVYERPLAALIEAVLPPGLYAEPAAAGHMADKPIFARCLRFALDGWNVVQLIEPRATAARAKWMQDAAEQLVAAGVPADVCVLVLVDMACGGPLSIKTPLRAAHTVIADRGLTSGLMLVFGPIAAGPAPPVHTFTANGLAG